MAAVAQAAGVAVPTVCKVFHTKAALVKRVYDVIVAGDDEPVPIRQRPEGQAPFTETDPRRSLAAFARLARLLSERLGPLLGVLAAGAASGDGELEALVGALEEERRTATGRIARHLADTGGLRPGLTERRAHDVLWLLTASEMHTRLVGQLGWSLDDYQEWLADSLARLLVDLDPEPRGRPASQVPAS
jgi:AcrR family transcriptional regulator